MNYCPKCGANLADAAAFCSGCGAALASFPAATEREPTAPGKKREHPNFRYVGGVPGLDREMGVTVVVDDAAVHVRSFGSVEASIPIPSIVSAVANCEKEILENQKSVVGRAVIGGLLTGGIGALVGGMSGLQSKKTKKESFFVAVTWADSGAQYCALFKSEALFSKKRAAMKLAQDILARRQKA